MKSSSSHNSVERSLAAIVLTDAVSFSARMSVDEEGTLTLIQRDLDLIAEQCECFGGKVLKSTGDGLLMSFYSAVQAVLCSQEVQKRFAKLGEGLPREEYLQHRIGIHLGDVLFSQDDVLGNGVNIAARLQTKSTPGGICISQTVYDVVKARVDINASYLGPLKLKNIQEPVSAYQIPPFGESATMVVAQQPSAIADAPPSDIAAAAANLEQNPQYRRIKKLVFSIYQGVWENDPKVLAQFDLAAMLEHLQQRHATLMSLEQALYMMASRLNHRERYLAIAEIILTTLEPVYCSSDDDVDPAPAEPAHDFYQQIADQLSQHSDYLRIKKLLYAMLHSAWENDPAALALHTMTELVTDVHHMAPSEGDLSYHLERIVKRLNRQKRYTQLALIVSEAFHTLYGSLRATATADPTATPDQTVVAGEQTAMSSDATAMVSEEGLTSLTGWVSAETAGEPTCARPSQAVATSDVGGLAEGAVVSVRDRASLYNLRVEIMRYTNPLRAKILLLSTVRSPFTASRQDWITLKSKSLDDLIQDTFEYCETFSDLESKLTIMCHCVDNVGENIQTAGAILQAMKPFYP